MSKIGPREAALRAMREAQFEERQQRQHQITQPAKPVPTPDKPMANASHVANRDMANRSMKPRSLAGTTTYRYRNADQRRDYMRDLMRRLRAERRSVPA